ncbi:MAG: fucose isomerase [Actinobacteria bacterium]|nr:fucose isomerase [Actinomycetota bacterium]
MTNLPDVRIALVGVSRDCFPTELTRSRLGQLAKECRKKGLTVVVAKNIIENESDTVSVLGELRDRSVNAAVVYLGNFGPEGPLSVFAKEFDGPVMACAAAEETRDSLLNNRGDALCGLLNASYNFGLRNSRVYIPSMPVGQANHLAECIANYEAVSRIVLGISGLKIISFGPRPHDFYACNAPIGPLYDLGIEVMENSELDLLQMYQRLDCEDPEVKRIELEMKNELGGANPYPELLPKLAKFEYSLLCFAEENLGSRDFAVFANKCWPAFQKAFGFMPCYVNSRLATQGMPVACEVDIYGALSEYLCCLATKLPSTLLDINNTVPSDLIPANINLKGAGQEDLFMGYHCGNTPSCCMKNFKLTYQQCLHGLIEDPHSEPDITRGTLEGQLSPGPITLFRVQGDTQGNLAAYVAQGDILDIDPCSYGSIGVVSVADFGRFYRHVLIARHFPHHTAVGFKHCGDTLFDAIRLIGIDNIMTPLPVRTRYPGENPFDQNCSNITKKHQE